jgi:hypothetical protein
MSGGPHPLTRQILQIIGEHGCYCDTDDGCTGKCIGAQIEALVRAASPLEIPPTPDLGRESFMEIYEQNQRQFGLPVKRADGAEADSFDAFHKALTAEGQIFGVDPTVIQALCASLTESHRWLWSRLEAANRQADAYAEQTRALRGASQPGAPTPEMALMRQAIREQVGMVAADGSTSSIAVMHLTAMLERLYEWRASPNEEAVLAVARIFCRYGDTGFDWDDPRESYGSDAESRAGILQDAERALREAWGASQPGGTPMSGGPHDTEKARRLLWEAIQAIRSPDFGDMSEIDRRTRLVDQRIDELVRAASPPEIHSERIRRQWANSTAREITLSMAECLTEGRPVEAAIARAEEWLRGAALRDAPPQDGERLTVKDVALLYFAAEKRFQEAARGDHDGTCLGAGCSKCFMEGVQPLLDALRGRAPEGDATR